MAPSYWPDTDHAASRRQCRQTFDRRDQSSLVL